MLRCGNTFLRAGLPNQPAGRQDPLPRPARDCSWAASCSTARAASPPIRTADSHSLVTALLGNNDTRKASLRELRNSIASDGAVTPFGSMPAAGQSVNDSPRRWQRGRHQNQLLPLSRPSSEAMDALLAERATWNRDINRLLASAPLDELLAVVEAQCFSLDAINVATVLRGLAQMHGGDCVSSHLQRRVEAVVEKLCIQVVAGAVGFSPRTLASCAHSLASLGCLVPEVWIALGRNSLRRADELGTQDIANILWAFATVRYRAKPLFTRLTAAAAAKLHLPRQPFKAQELSNIAWALSSMGHSDPAFFSDLAPAVMDLPSEALNPQNIANLLWSFAKAGQRCPELFYHLGRLAASRSPDLTPQNLSNAAWAFATLGLSCDALFAALACELRRRPEAFSAQELAVSTWAMGKEGHYDAAALRAVAQAAKPRAAQLSPLGLSMIMWAFASLRHDEPLLFKCLLGEFTSPRITRQLTGRHISMVLWANATLTYSTAAMGQLGNDLLRRRSSELGAHELSNSLWALAVLDSLSPADIRSLTTAISSRRFAVEGLSQLLLAEYAVQLRTARGDSADPSDVAEVPRLLPPCVGELAREQWALKACQEAAQPPSSLQASVLDCLQAMGWTCYRHDNSMGSVLSAQISVGGRMGGDVLRVAVEPEGPSRYTRTEPFRPLGHTLLRRRLLRMSGWRLVVVPFYEWERLKGRGPQVAFLRSLFADAAVGEGRANVEE